jgi:catechol 2,3-dioxygenase-like lactoylglutathione lyase family enzyme
MLAAIAAALIQSAQAQPIVLGLDHIPVAVRDLERASDRYRALGFTLKPGRPHDNGIRNNHAKFADGTEIELITAPAVRDALTKTYVKHLAAGDGPAFLALFTRNQAGAATLLKAAGDLPYIFFGPRNASPTDRPEHFQHANGAQSLISVWLAAEDLAAEKRLLEAGGALMMTVDVRLPAPQRVPIAKLREGDIVLLSVARQLVPGRRIVGATVRTSDVTLAQRALSAAGLETPPVVETKLARSLFVPDSMAHGLTIEFREIR